MQAQLFDEMEINWARYFIIISPPAAVVSAVRGFKQRLDEEIGLDGMNKHSKAHISLYRVDTRDNDAVVIAAVTKAVEHLYCFEIQVDGAGVFSHGNTSSTLYLKIERPEPVRRIAEAVTGMLAAKKSELIMLRAVTDGLPATKGQDGSMPHLTIARGVPNKKFRLIDPASFHYRYEFVCDRITILKWEDRKYRLIHEVPLRPLQGVPG